MMQVSQHAQQRMQQRGIRPEDLDVLDYFGMEYQQKGGCLLLELSKVEFSSLKKKVKSLSRSLDRMESTYAIVSDDGTCVTTSHKYKQIRHL